jgi:hypothetical protein
MSEPQKQIELELPPPGSLSSVALNELIQHHLVQAAPVGEKDMMSVHISTQTKFVCKVIYVERK